MCTFILYVLYFSIPALPSHTDLRQLTSTGLYLSDQLSSEGDDDTWSGSDTPTPQVAPNQWSDATLTGRSSFCSWGEDEGVSLIPCYSALMQCTVCYCCYCACTYMYACIGMCM